MAGGLLGIKPTPNVFSNGEKADVAGESLVYTGPSNPHLASSGGTPPNGDLRMATNSLWEAAFGKPKLCLGNLPQPQCLFAQEGNTCLVLTWPYVPIGPRRVWAASGSVGTAAWLVVSAAGNQLQTSSPSRRRLIWPEEALCALALATPPEPAREGPT